MVKREHRYHVDVSWKATAETGTRDYRSYSRDHRIQGAGKITEVPGSSDPMFRGDGSRYNPEELLVAALSSCHLLWMLNLCAEAGIVMTEYVDSASGVMIEEPGTGGRMTEVTLRPHLTITDPARVADARSLNARAHELCFIANSVNFPVAVEPEVTSGTSEGPKPAVLSTEAASLDGVVK